MGRICRRARSGSGGPAEKISVSGVITPFVGRQLTILNCTPRDTNSSPSITCFESLSAEEEEEEEEEEAAALLLRLLAAAAADAPRPLAAALAPAADAATPLSPAIHGRMYSLKISFGSITRGTLSPLCSSTFNGSVANTGKT